MDSNSFNQQKYQVKELLLTDPISAYQYLREFSQLYCRDEKIQEEILMLGTEIFDLLEEEKTLRLSPKSKQEIFEKSLSLLESASNETITADDSENDLQITNLRNFFIENRPNETVFRSSDLSKHFPTFTLENISLELKLGEITGVIGENGNGKSTLLKMVAGELSPTSGVYSYPMVGSGKLDWKKIKQSIAYVPQTISSWTGTKNVLQHLQFTAAIKGIPPEKNLTAVNFVLTRLGIRKYQHYSWSELSGGFQLRFELAKQLIWNPKLLILDEPLANLDVKGQNMLLADLRNLANSQKNPMAILMSSHHIYDVENIADNVIFIKEGKPIYNGPVEGISVDSRVKCYMLDIDCNLLDLQKVLSDISDKILEIKDDFEHKIIFTAPELNTADFLKTLLSSPYSIGSFRDISNSTRIYFENIPTSVKKS